MANGPTISAIAAIGKNRELGKKGKLIWSIPEDMRHFKEKTKGHPIIMGRKTYESIGKPLLNRTNIVVTRNADFDALGCIIVSSVEDAIEEAKKHDAQEIFIIGGGQIYEQAMCLTDKLYLTIVDESSDADTFFPEYSKFDKVIHREDVDTEKYQFSFVELEK
ncbi:dihydrofolate reductase [Patescibacteria group bacterium]|nr:dihydrofolate reductase [Patescibacteria group bacterium]